MSGLFYTKRENAGGNLLVDVEAYIAFIDDLFAGNAPYYDIIGEDGSRDRIKRLRDYSGHGGSAFPRRRLKVLDCDGTQQNASNGNTKLTVEFEVCETAGNKNKRKVVITLPAENPMASADGLNYLDKFVEALIKTALDTEDPPIAELERARKLLLGMMLLTRCM
jgi:hypothetical protein